MTSSVSLFSPLSSAILGFHILLVAAPTSCPQLYHVAWLEIFFLDSIYGKLRFILLTLNVFFPPLLLVVARFMEGEFIAELISQLNFI